MFNSKSPETGTITLLVKMVTINFYFYIMSCRLTLLVCVGVGGVHFVASPSRVGVSVVVVVHDAGRVGAAVGGGGRRNFARGLPAQLPRGPARRRARHHRLQPRLHHLLRKGNPRTQNKVIYPRSVHSRWIVRNAFKGKIGLSIFTDIILFCLWKSNY